MSGYKSAYRNGRVVDAHVVIAERALGHPLPSGAEVHHVDENKRNNANTNLVICQDKAYHWLLHRRAKVLRAGGNPNTDRYCGHCKTVKPATEFSPGHRRSTCKKCRSAIQLVWWRKKKAERHGPRDIAILCGDLSL